MAAASRLLRRPISRRKLMRTPFFYRTESGGAPETSEGRAAGVATNNATEGGRPGAKTKRGASAPWPEAVCIYTDGASRGNPGPCAFGFQVFSWNEKEGAKPGADLVHEGRGFLSRHNTNNFAEYQAVAEALKTAQEKGVQKLILYSDSLLLISQLNGHYKVKSPVIRPLFRQCRELLKCFAFYRLEHIPREKNSGADALANQALDEASLPASE